MTLQVGYAHAIITPSLDHPVYLAGFGQNRTAQSVHDDLYCRALVLQNGDARLALVALDLIGVGRSHCLEVEQRVNAQIPNTRVIIACTHTHHGPDTIGLWGPDPTTRGVDDVYFARLLDTIVIMVLAASSTLHAAPLCKAASARVPGVAHNFRDAAIVDDELTGQQFCVANGAPLATMLIFPCHPEVLWENNLHLTSDYAHSLRREVEAATGAPCIFFVGALGGMLSPDVKDHSFKEKE